MSYPSSCPGDAHHTDNDPEEIQDRVSGVFSQDRAPGKQGRIGRVEYPDEHERAGGPKPADEREAEYPHQDSDHLERLDIGQYETVYDAHKRGTKKIY